MSRGIIVLAIALALPLSSADVSKNYRAVIAKNNTAGGGGTVTVITSSNDGGGESPTTDTLVLVVSGETDPVIYVGTGTGSSGGVDGITSVSSSINGAFTELAQATDSNWVNGQMWRLTGPSNGSHTITITYDGPIHGGACGVLLSNVSQGTPNGTVVTATNTGTAPTASATISSTGMVVAFVVTDDNDGFAVTTGTQLEEIEGIGGDTGLGLAYNTGSGSVDVTWATDSEGWVVLAVPVNGN